MNWFDEYLLERDAYYYEDHMKRINKVKKNLSKFADQDLLKIAIKRGENLNTVTEHFPAYDVALKLHNNNWTPTAKQRNAIINVLAYYIATEE